MKILIIGVSGFIGQHLFEHLMLKHEVFGISRKNLNNPNCFSIDLLNRDELSVFLNKNEFEVIINLAAITTSKKNQHDFSLLNDNILISQNLIYALQNIKKCHFINFSSSSVYPNVSGKFSEENMTDPSKNNDCLYGISKIVSENLFNYFLKNLKILNLRVGYVYGKGMDKSRIHEIFLNELKLNNQITLWGEGERIIPQIRIHKLLEFINLFINSKKIGTYNLAEENVSFIEIAKRYIKEKGNKNSKIVLLKKGSKEKFKIDLSKLNSFIKNQK